MSGSIDDRTQQNPDNPNQVKLLRDTINEAWKHYSEGYLPYETIAFGQSNPGPLQGPRSQASYVIERKSPGFILFLFGAAELVIGVSLLAASKNSVWKKIFGGLFLAGGTVATVLGGYAFVTFDTIVYYDLHWPAIGKKEGDVCRIILPTGIKERSKFQELSLIQVADWNKKNYPTAAQITGANKAELEETLGEINSESADLTHEPDPDSVDAAFDSPDNVVVPPQSQAEPEPSSDQQSQAEASSAHLFVESAPDAPSSKQVSPSKGTPATPKTKITGIKAPVERSAEPAHQNTPDSLAIIFE